MIEFSLPRYIYNVIPEKHYHTNLGEYSTYGIKVTGPECSTVLHDVSGYKDIVTNMIKLFNECQLSPVHLKDAVEDILP